MKKPRWNGAGTGEGSKNNQKEEKIPVDSVRRGIERNEAREYTKSSQVKFLDSDQSGDDQREAVIGRERYMGSHVHGNKHNDTHTKNCEIVFLNHVLCCRPRLPQIVGKEERKGGRQAGRKKDNVEILLSDGSFLCSHHSRLLINHLEEQYSR